MSKIILDLCGGTGSWSRPYKEAGYDVRLVTLPDNDVCTYRPPDDVYGILAAPPCTMFSFARTNAKKPRSFTEGLVTVDACLRIIRLSYIRGGLKFWALENPFGYLRRFLGRPPFTFQPFDFGDAYKKRTDLWGYFNEPKKNPVLPDSSRNTAHGEDWHHNASDRPKGMDRATYRAITPKGFAEAFFQANR